MITDSSRDFGTIDLNSGLYNSIGQTLSGSSPLELAGLGELGSTLYGASLATGQGILYTINTTTGALTQQGTAALPNYVAFGSTLTTLYAVAEDNSGNFDLYSVNSTTGAAAEVGALGLKPGGDYTLSTNSSTLYFTDDSAAFTPSLYTLSLTTGAATLVGSTGGAQFGGLVTEGGVLYGGAHNTLQVDTLNTGTGAPTFVSTLDGTSSDFDGLAAIPATSGVPEPRTVSWLLLGLLAGAGWIKTRSNRQRLQPNNRTTE
jgi:hypothetical protein